MSESPTTVEAAIKFALSQVGKPYKYGAIGPDAYDCSSLCWRAYQAGGVEITRSTGTQRLKGTAVTGDWLPGDLLFSHSPQSPSGSHVKMYIGGGRVVEAPRTGLNVRVADAPSRSELNAVRRYVKTAQTASAPTYQKAGFGLDDAGKLAGNVAGKVYKYGTAPGLIFGGGGSDIKDGVTDAYDASKAVLSAAAFIINPHNWFRVAMFLGGLALIWVTLSSLASGKIDTALGLKSAISGASKSAAKGIEATA